MRRLFAACALACALVTASGAAAQPNPGIFDTDRDIGETAFPGSLAFDPAAGTYTITSSGANIWGEKDAFHYAWTRRSGDLHIAADFRWLGQGTDPHRKAGLMIRQNLTPGSPYADVMVHGDGMTSLQYRVRQDGPTYQIISATWQPRRVRLEREGDFVYFSVAGADGKLRHAGGSFRIALQAPYYVGLALSAHNNTVKETGVFSNVTLEVPKLAYVPDTGYAAKVESTLEVMDVGGIQSRRVVRQFDGKIEAPNWTKDGASLLYNADGRLWRIAVDGKSDPVPVNTGPLQHLNNDHGISPKGDQVIVSDQSEPDNLSRISLLPIGGSARPKSIVSDPAARSYWHGWSPDGRAIAYVRVGASDDSYDIYSADLATGKRAPLIVGPGVDDGPEYSPDGQWLYFNSTRSGAMQIWRAHATGTSPEQITHDPNFRDWFPHLSPDGKWIVFISFGLDVALGDHPPNRSDVALRIMPADGSSPPVVLTRPFGGQGTINVPSWSPDSKQIAFVSYRVVR
jgi:Tol biopolymer transport system component